MTCLRDTRRQTEIDEAAEEKEAAFSCSLSNTER